MNANKSMLIGETNLKSTQGHGNATVRFIQTGVEKYMVVAYLPAGMTDGDMPEVFRTDDYSKAENCYKGWVEHFGKMIKAA